MDLQKKLNQFLEEHCSCQRPILLAFSGGPDSMALFHLLKHCNYPFEAAHIDHNWRSNSASEAAYLRDLCEKNDVPFHLKQLTAPEKASNLEEKGRNTRLEFFQSLIQKHSLQGVFLAHHADDQAETVLKRLFEGANLEKLRALRPVCFHGELVLYRPFLKIRKGALINWLQEKNIAYFVDPTNGDPRFLRGRLRESLMPFLSQEFGKEVTPALCKIGEAAAEFEVFLETLIAPFREQIQTTSEGIVLDFQKSAPSSSFLWKAVIRDFGAFLGMSFPQTIVDSLYEHLHKGSCHKILVVGKHQLKVHRKKLMINLSANCSPMF